MQLPSRSCYHCDWLRRTATAGAKAGAPPCAGRRLCVLLIGQHGHVAPYHPSPPHSVNRRTKYQRIYRPRAPHFVRLQIRARIFVSTGLQPPPCYRSCSLASSSSFPMDLCWSTGCTTDFQRRCLRARGCPGIAAPSLRDNARRHDQGMHFHSVDVVSINLITHRQYLYLLLCLIAVLINEYSPLSFSQFQYLFNLAFEFVYLVSFLIRKCIGNWLYFREDLTNVDWVVHFRVYTWFRILQWQYCIFQDYLLYRSR